MAVERLCWDLSLMGRKEDVVTVIVVGYEEVVVASAGRDREASGLVSVDDAFGFGGG